MIALADSSEVPQTPWHKATANQRSQRQEKRLGDKPGGERQPNSGRLWFAKRDVRLNGFLVEARTTKSASYTISQPEFDAIIRQALGTPPGQLAAMQIDFEQGSGLSLFVTRLEDHEWMIERLAALEAEVEELKGG